MPHMDGSVNFLDNGLFNIFYYRNLHGLFHHFFHNFFYRLFYDFFNNFRLCQNDWRTAPNRVAAGGQVFNIGVENFCQLDKFQRIRTG